MGLEKGVTGYSVPYGPRWRCNAWLAHPGAITGRQSSPRSSDGGDTDTRSRRGLPSGNAPGFGSRTLQRRRSPYGTEYPVTPFWRVSAGEQRRAWLRRLYRGDNFVDEVRKVLACATQRRPQFPRVLKRINPPARAGRHRGLRPPPPGPRVRLDLDGVEART